MARRGPNQERSNSRVERIALGQYAYGRSSKDAQGMIDISQTAAGQNGFQTNLEGYVNNASYVQKNLIAVLVEAPKGFNHLPNPRLWFSTLKTLVEVQPKTITGLDQALTVENVETPVGSAGEFQEDTAKVTRARSVPVHTYDEKYGRVINAFHKGWILNLIGDPITNVPNIMARNGPKPTDLLPDYNSMTVLYIEPDPTHTRVVQAFLCTNMRPKGDGTATAQRDLTAAGELTEQSIEYTALTQVGEGVDAFAQRYLDEMNLAANNPNIKPAFLDQIEAQVRSVVSGYQDQLDHNSRTSIPVTDPNRNAATDQDYSPQTGDAGQTGVTPNMGYTGTNYRTNGQ